MLSPGCTFVLLISKRGPLEHRIDCAQDLIVLRAADSLARHKDQIVSERATLKLPRNTVANLAAQAISLHRVCQFFTDRDSDPEITDRVPGIKKRKTVERQSFSFHGGRKIAIFS